MQVGEQVSAASAARKTCIRISSIHSLAVRTTAKGHVDAEHAEETSKRQSGAGIPLLHTEACDHPF